MFRRTANRTNADSSLHPYTVLFKPRPNVNVRTTCSDCRLSTQYLCVIHMAVTIKSDYFPSSMNCMAVTIGVVFSARQETILYSGLIIRKEVHPSMHGATAPSGLCPPSKSASIFLYPELVSSILEFPESTLHPSGKRAPILFLVFLLTLYCGIPH